MSTRANGRGMRNESQLLSRHADVADAAAPMTGAPVRCATTALPGANDFAGPRGPSGVMARSCPSSTRARETEQRARRAARRRAAHGAIAEARRDPRDDLAVGVLADQHRDALVAMMIQQREQLPVPEREDDRLLRRRAARRTSSSCDDANAPGPARAARTSQHAGARDPGDAALPAVASVAHGRLAPASARAISATRTAAPG